MFSSLSIESDFTLFYPTSEMGNYFSHDAAIGSIVFTDAVDFHTGILLVNPAGYALVFPTEFDRTDLDKFFLSLGQTHIDKDGLVLTDAVLGSSQFHRRLAGSRYIRYKSLYLPIRYTSSSEIDKSQ